MSTKKIQEHNYLILKVKDTDLIKKKFFKLDEFLKKYFKDDTMFGEKQVECIKCVSMTDEIAKTNISHFPIILVIEINKNLRLKGVNKEKFQVRFPYRNWKIKEFEDVAYDLIACIEHFGADIDCDHYIANILNRIDEKWYQYNDDDVKKISQYNINKSSEKKLFISKELLKIKIV